MFCQRTEVSQTFTVSAICLSSVWFDNSRHKTLPLTNFLRRDVLPFSLNLFSKLFLFLFLFLFLYQRAEASSVTNSDTTDSSSAPVDSVREEKLLLSPFLCDVIDTSPSPFPLLLHLLLQLGPVDYCQRSEASKPFTISQRGNAPQNRCRFCQRENPWFFKIPRLCRDVPPQTWFPQFLRSFSEEIWLPSLAVYTTLRRRSSAIAISPSFILFLSEKRIALRSF